MSDDFSRLWRFLERVCPQGEVIGRTGETLPEDLKDRLRQFAQGALSSAEREVVVREIQDDPQWIAFLAEEVKARRAPPPSRP